MCSAECWRCLLYSSIHAATRHLACARVVKCSTQRNSNSIVECQDSITALSGPAHRLPHDAAPARVTERVSGVFAALVSVHDHTGNGIAAAASGNCHHQRRIRQVGVVVFVQAEATMRLEPMSSTLSRNSLPSSV